MRAVEGRLYRSGGALPAALIAALLFSNLAARITGYSFLNAALVALVLITATLQLSAIRTVRAIDLVALALALTIALFSLDPRNGSSAALATLYVFGLPVIAHFSGVYLSARRRSWAPWVFHLILVAMAYGVAQAILFLTGDLANVLPWDAKWVADAQESGVSNLYQAALLRFFGTMNSFFEFQLITSILVPYTWLLHRNHPDVISVRPVVILTLLHAVFLLLALERTPIIVAAIMYSSLLRRPRDLRSLGRQLPAVVILGVAAFIMGPRMIQAQESINYHALDRLTDVITLDFASDSSIATRVDSIWISYWRLFSENFWLGIGSGRLSDDSLGLAQAQPHNGYLAYGLAFGALTLLMLFAYLFAAVSHGKSSTDRRFLGALIVAYSLVAIFDVPWMGKTGVAFFLLVGVLLPSPTSPREEFSSTKDPTAGHPESAR